VLTWAFLISAVLAAGPSCIPRCGCAASGASGHSALPIRPTASRIGGVGVDPGRADLSVPEDALDHVLLTQQSAGGVPGVVQPGVLGDSRLASWVFGSILIERCSMLIGGCSL
jgi:hypothetical protein